MPTIEKTYDLPFEVGTVYSAWISPETVIPPATSMDIEPVVGGHYRLFMQADGFTSRSEGRFLLVRPETRLRYTWEWNGDGEITEIDVTFEDTGGNTRLTICHGGFRSAESAAMHDAGWDSYIEGLGRFIADRDRAGTES